jgi:transposase-like protein
MACPARGHIGAGNIGVHSRKDKRYVCHVCGKTFTASKATPFYRLRTPLDLVVLVVTLLAHGCPPQAIVAAFRLDERTVASWQERAGKQCARLHEHLVQRPRDLAQVQADELRVKKQGGILWLAMAIQVSTRLWLGATLSAHRDGDLISALMQKVRACALCRPLLFCTDGFRAYLHAIRQVFREPLCGGRGGRYLLRPWDNVCIAQMVKQYACRQLVGVIRRVVQGSTAQVAQLLQQTQRSALISTVYIERINATFRSCLSALVRRGRSLVQQTATLYDGVYLVGTVYNFCSDHESLRLPGIVGGRKWLPRTPAMAAGLADHRWTVKELLLYPVPPPRWTPPQRRGRPSAAMKRLIAQWA